MAEALFYLALWTAFPFLGVRLSYLCFAIGRPLTDTAFAHADDVLGLDWLAWANFVSRHPLFLRAQWIAYGSYIWQPAVAVVVLALRRPREGNAELFNALFISLVLTLVTVALFPAIGALAALGLNAPAAPIVHILREAPAAHPLPYSGIVAFPSFHTVMAILFVYASRGSRYLFPAAFLLNALVVISVPLGGDHYFVDVFGGAVVSFIGITIARTMARASRHRGIHPAGAALLG